jgi:hypothetical protein
MASAVQVLQKALLNGSKPLGQLLRETKVIAAKLNLDDVETWVSHELKGYPAESNIPEHRFVRSSHLEVFNPYRGWQFSGTYERPFPVYQSVHDIEELATGEDCYITPRKKIRVSDQLGRDCTDDDQRLSIPPSEMRSVLQAIRDELLEWTIELEKRGIKGEDMDFDEKEKQSAASQTFHIQKFTGVLGNVSNSQVSIYDYGSIHQTLKEQNVPQEQRNQLENIMDELKAAPPDKKQTLLDNAKAWVVRNKDFLGASVNIVKKALGFPDS